RMLLYDNFSGAMGRKHATFTTLVKTTHRFHSELQDTPWSLAGGRRFLDGVYASRYFSAHRCLLHLRHRRHWPCADGASGDTRTLSWNGCLRALEPDCGERFVVDAEVFSATHQA